MRGAKYKVLHAALSLDNFTTDELASYSGVPKTTVVTSLSRLEAFFDVVEVQKTGRRGGQPKRRVVKPDQRRVLIEILENELPNSGRLPRETQLSTLTIVVEHLNDMETGNLRESHKQSLIEFCSKKLAVSRMIAKRLPDGEAEAAHEEIQAATDRLDRYFVKTSDIEAMVERGGFEFISNMQEKISKIVLVFDFIKGDMDMVTAKSLESISSMGFAALRIPIEECNSSEDAMRQMGVASDMLSPSFWGKSVHTGMIATFDTRDNPQIACGVSGFIPEYHRSVSANVGAQVVLDQYHNQTLKNNTLVSGGVYVSNTGEMPVADVIKAQIKLT